MKVREVMTENVACCHPQDNSNLAAQLMWDRDCGVIPVVDDEAKVVGMVTDRDLCMGAYTRGKALNECSVADVMSSDVFSCKGSDSLGAALKVMGDHQVRRLPVLDADRRVVGLISVNDVVCAYDQGLRRPDRLSLATSVLETLGSVCQHRSPEEELTPRPKAAPRKSKPEALPKVRA